MISEDCQNSINYMKLINDNDLNNNKNTNHHKSHAETIKLQTQQQFYKNQNESSLNQQ